MTEVTNSECITSSDFTVATILRHTKVVVFSYRGTFGDITAIVDKTLKIRAIEEIRVGDKARVTLAFMPDKKALYCVFASIVAPDHLVVKPLHHAVNSVDDYPVEYCVRLLNTKGRDLNGIYVGIGSIVGSLDCDQSARFRPYYKNAPKMVNAVKRVGEDDVGPSKRVKREGDEVTIVAVVEKPQLTALPIVEAEMMNVKLMEKMERIKKAFLESAQLLQGMASVDPELLKEILHHRPRPNVSHRVKSRCSTCSTNIDKAFFGDTARVTFSFMPDMKTLFLVKASILFANEDRRHEIREISEPHIPINSVDMVARYLCEQFLKCEGRSADDKPIGWIRVIKALMATRLCKSALKSTTETCTTPVLPPTVRQPRREHVEVQLPAPLLHTPLVSPQNGTSEESTTTVVKESNRQKKNMIEGEPEKSDEEVKRMSSRQVVDRIKKTMFSSTKLLQQIANVDPELVAAIAGR